MLPELHVLTRVTNPVRWRSRYHLCREFQRACERAGARLWVIEGALGERPHEVTDAGNPRHIRVGIRDELWHKENLLNVLLSKLPTDARHIAWVDADVTFLRPDWVAETVQQLQHYAVVQMFSEAQDLGPDGHVFNRYRSFAWSHCHGVPRPRPKDGGGYAGKAAGTGDDPGIAFWHHPGFAWAARREALDLVGGIFDQAVVGEGDYIMAKALVGEVEDVLYPRRVRGLPRGHPPLAGPGPRASQEPRVCPGDARAPLARTEGRPELLEPGARPGRERLRSAHGHPAGQPGRLPAPRRRQRSVPDAPRRAAGVLQGPQRGLDRPVVLPPPPVRPPIPHPRPLLRPRTRAPERHTSVMSNTFFASAIGIVLSVLAAAWRLFVVPHLRSAVASRALSDAGGYAAIVVRRAASRLPPGITLATLQAPALAALKAETTADLRALYPHLVADLGQVHSPAQVALVLESEIENQIAALAAAPLPAPAPSATPAAALPTAPTGVRAGFLTTLLVLALGLLAVGCGPLPAPDGGVPAQTTDATVTMSDVPAQPVTAAVVAQRAELVIQTLPPAVQLATAIIQLDPQIASAVKARVLALLQRLAGVLIPDLENALAAFCGPGGVAHCAADPAHQCLLNDAAAGLSTGLADFAVDIGTSLDWTSGPVIGAAISACGAIVDVSLPACHPPTSGLTVHFGEDLALRLHALPMGLRPMPTLAEVQAMVGDAGVSVPDGVGRIRVRRPHGAAR